MSKIQGVGVRKVTPALLVRGKGGSLQGRQTHTDTDYQTGDRSGRFLTNLTHRAFPLNLPSRSQSTEPYINPFLTYDPSPSHPPHKTETTKHRKHQSMITEEHSTVKAAGKLPVLRYAMFRKDGKLKEFGKSQYYEDYIVGGSNYNRDVSDPLYQPQVITINPKTRLRLFTRHHYTASPSLLSSPSPLPPSAHISHQSSSLPVTSPVLPSEDSVTNYPTPALSFSDKMQRIQKLAAFTLASIDSSR